MCRKRLSSPRCRSELIDSAWVVIDPGQKCIKKNSNIVNNFGYFSTIFTLAGSDGKCRGNFNYANISQQIPQAGNIWENCLEMSAIVGKLSEIVGKIVGKLPGNCQVIVRKYHEMTEIAARIVGNLLLGVPYL